MQTRLNPVHPDADRLSFEELENQIRNRAYQLYEDRGCGDDHALDDWLNAKAQVPCARAFAVHTQRQLGQPNPLVAQSSPAFPVRHLREPVRIPRCVLPEFP